MTGKQSSDAMKPPVFAILYSLTPKDIDTVFYDECVEKLPDVIDGDMLVLSVETLAAKRAYFLVNKYRQNNPQLTVVMGGFHPTAVPDEALLYADSIVTGDAEPVWENLLADYKKGELKPVYTSENGVMLPYSKTDYSIFDGKKYAKIGVVQWKRGCKYNCNFCSVKAFYKSCIARREINDVIDEIANSKEKVIFIADDNLLHNKDELKAFLTRLIPLKKKWGCQISIDTAKDFEILELMNKSGCLMAIIGFESLNDANLSEIGKKQRVAEYNEAVRVIHSYGIMIYATFIFGYAGDTPDCFDHVYKFAIRNKLAIVNFNPLLAMPGTAVYEELRKKDKLIDPGWWLSENYQYGDATHYPDMMTAQQLSDGCKKLRYKFYSVSGIMRRLFKPVNIKHLMVYMLINTISFVEIRRKQKLKHGGDIHK